MKKKFLLLFLLLILVFGCSKKEELNNGTKTDTKKNAITIMGDEYIFDTNDTVYDLKLVIPSNFKKQNNINAVSYLSCKDSPDNYLAIRIFEYKNKDVDYALSNLTNNGKYEKSIKTINGIDYTYTNTESDIHVYVYTHTNKTTYAFTFAVKDESKLDKLVDLFLKNVSYAN